MLILSSIYIPLGMHRRTDMNTAIRRPHTEAAARFGSVEFRTVVATADLASLCVFEVELAPRCLSGPRHTHANEDAVTYVLEGTFVFQVGNETVEASAGSAVVQPRGVPHTFWNPGPTVARGLDICAPGGLDEYFDGLANKLASGDQAELETVLSYGEQFGLEMDWESLPELVEQYGLRFGPTA
jgi:quercetin dioxygenase-like cupin family protein